MEGRTKGHRPMAENGIRSAFEPHPASLRSLRNTVLFRLFLVALIPLAALSIYLRQQFLTLLDQRSHLVLSTIASSHRDSIDHLVLSKVNALRSLADNDLLSLPPSKTEMEALLSVLQGLDSTILDIGLFDADGNHVRYAGPVRSLEGKNYSSEPWFQVLSHSLSTFFISDIYLGYRGQPHSIIAVRTQRNGDPWYWRITIDPVGFNRIVNNVQGIEGANAFIINPDGVYQSVADGFGKILDKDPALADIHQEEGMVDLQQQGRPVLLAYSRMKTVDWILIVRQDLSIAYRPFQRISRGMYAIVSAGVVFIVIASLYATKTLVRRYQRSEIERGQLIDQLVQAGKISTLGEMAAGVAHEINNPLAVILSEAGVMEDYLDPSLPGAFDPVEFRKKLESIKEEAFRCKGVTHKLLGFARRNEPTLGMHRPNDLIRQSIELIQRELTFDNIEFELDLNDSLPDMRTDGEKIKQVLLNLIKNSADAIGKNGKIVVRSERAGDFIRLRVEDNGCGIPKERLADIFLPFFTTKEVGKGTGLGLSITHGIIESMGGKISVASEVGIGTSFEILLPIEARPSMVYTKT